MSHQDHNQHGHNQHHHHGKSKSKVNFVIWVGVTLMLVAMLIYVLTDDESIQPGGPPSGAVDSAPVPAAP